MSLYLTLHTSTLALLHTTWLYITVPWLYFTLLDSTLLYIGSTSLYLTLHYSNMALLTVRNLWSCDDWKGYSPEDQQFFWAYFQNETCGHAMIGKGTPLKTSNFLSIFPKRNLWSCDDRKGYSPEDQQFFEHISKRNLWSCDDRKGYSPEDQQFFEHISKWNSSLLCHKCPTH